MKKVEFYYKGKLIRKSATHFYTHFLGIFEKDTDELVSKAIACSSTRSGAEKALAKWAHYYRLKPEYEFRVAHIDEVKNIWAIKRR